ncbi:putative 2-(5''-triphosphoribosyl)-3'-dephosphocoenzyme-A synthase [Acrocarpospora corrugata]|uniref:triphosphoribosyl-dephospho-CoA synthase n=1 Tax=Acrocarpospora corrugata TaxID=35763 RepID=A0A5M3W535_9ACTN|nr:triphosphoribosyl-dephospho-CoA synthase [Acrocarpospora corrugata]GES02373.1 putative 2-(5''-triphosphoribosyl)-3'-dephosphocoenzyme-A synthase [Acrocarpospora corrugata]
MTGGRAAMLADLAVRALGAEARLGPKPGLVDHRGGGAHGDMDLPLMLASAEALRPVFRSLAVAAQRMAVGSGLRTELGRIGRAGERVMLGATRGVNTHRGALWALGLLVAGAATAADEPSAVGRAARLAALPDAADAEGASGSAASPDADVPASVLSHGERVRRRFGVPGARGEAAAGFPHVVEVALPRLRQGRAAGHAEDVARLDALLAVMSHLNDTCVLHRGGLAGLRVVRTGAARVLAEGGTGTVPGRTALAELDERLRAYGLSPGGSGDLLAAALFLDMVPRHGSGAETDREAVSCRR